MPDPACLRSPPPIPERPSLPELRECARRYIAKMEAQGTPLSYEPIGLRLRRKLAETEPQDTPMGTLLRHKLLAESGAAQGDRP